MRSWAGGGPLDPCGLTCGFPAGDCGFDTYGFDGGPVPVPADAASNPNNIGTESPSRLESPPAYNVEHGDNQSSTDSWNGEYESSAAEPNQVPSYDSSPLNMSDPSPPSQGFEELPEEGGDIE